MNIQPLNDRIMILRDSAEDVSPGGILIPQQAKEAPRFGTVVAVGAGKVTEAGNVLPMDVKPGDRVLFAQYAGVEVKIEGRDYIMLRQEDILGIMNDGEAPHVQIDAQAAAASQPAAAAGPAS